MSEDVVVIGGARTPFCEWLGGKQGDGEAGGRLAEVSAEQLGSIAIRGALEKTGTSPESVDHLVICLLYTSPSPRDISGSRMPSSA